MSELQRLQVLRLMAPQRIGTGPGTRAMTTFPTTYFTRLVVLMGPSSRVALDRSAVVGPERRLCQIGQLAKLLDGPRGRLRWHGRSR
jgi:hypothetical protein